MNYEIAWFLHARDRIPKRKILTIDQLSTRLTRFDERDEKDGPLWSPTVYQPGATRAAAHVQSLCCAVADIDSKADLDAITEAAAGWFYVLHSTFSFTAEAPKFRLVLPLAEPVERDNWAEFWAGLRLHLSISGIHLDEACKDPSRIYYLPSCRPKAERLAYTNDGNLLHANDLPQPVRLERVQIPSSIPLEIPDAIALLDVACKRGVPGNRSNAAFWLACQLRDNQYDQDTAEEIISEFTARVGGGTSPFTIREGLAAVQQAYRRPAREPSYRPPQGGAPA